MFQVRHHSLVFRLWGASRGQETLQRPHRYKRTPDKAQFISTANAFKLYLETEFHFWMSLFFLFQHQRRSRAVAPAAPADHEEVSPPSVQPPNRRRGRQGSFWSSKLLEKLKEKLKNKQKKVFTLSWSKDGRFWPACISAAAPAAAITRGTLGDLQLFWTFPAFHDVSAIRSWFRLSGEKKLDCILFYFFL